MSLLTPELVPVKVYRWDDEGAPALDKSAGCMMTIFKACLVTGYGTKEGAGWTMPFEDTVNGIKVFKPAMSSEQEFFLRLSTDSGQEVTVQVYLNMTNVDAGDLKLQCATPFKYAKSLSSGRWILIASSRGFWFFCESGYRSQSDKRGAFLFCGDLSKCDPSSERPIWLNHTGGGYDDGDYSIILDKSQSVKSVHGKAYLPATQAVVQVSPRSAYFTGNQVHLNFDVYSQLHIFIDKSIYILPGILVPSTGPKNLNFSTTNIVMNGLSNESVCFSTGCDLDSNYYINLERWAY